MGKKDEVLEQARALVEQVRAELVKCEGRWNELSRLTNRELSYRWLVAFAKGDIKDPASSKVIYLARYLGMKFVTEPVRHFAKFKPETFQPE